MSWFSREHPIVHTSSTTFILAAEISGEPGSRTLTRLLYTGHDDAKGVVRASAPPKGTLWSATIENRDDANNGRVLVVGDVVVTYESSTGALIAREIWTGKTRWRTPVGRLVNRLGFDAEHDEIVAITFDHVVHGIAAATGATHSRGQVMTDESARKTMDTTPHPTTANSETGVKSRAWVPDWNCHYERAADIQVLEREWDGQSSWAVGLMDKDGAHGLVNVGTGRYRGMRLMDRIAVASFDLTYENEEDTCDHWLIFARQPVELLAIIRAQKPSELFQHGHAVWKGML